MTLHKFKFPPRLTGTDGVEAGKAVEKRFLREMEECRESGLFPPWLAYFEPSSPQENLEGIDVWAHTLDAGKIAIQIKRSHQERTKFLQRENRKHILCVVASPYARFSVIFSFTIAHLTQERKRRLNAKTASE
jgi:hypothetical protein